MTNVKINSVDTAVGPRYSSVRVNVPNLLSGLRLTLAPVAAVFFITPAFVPLAFALCCLGVLLDAVDGWYARRFGHTTVLGAFIDPLADKVMMAVVYGVIAVKMGSVAVWALLLVIVCRDIAVTVSRLRRYRDSGTTYPADGWGKLKTFVQSVAGVGILFFGLFVRQTFSFSPDPVVAILVVVAVLSYISAARYLNANTAKARASD